MKDWEKLTTYKAGHAFFGYFVSYENVSKHVKMNVFLFYFNKQITSWKLVTLAYCLAHGR